MVENESQQARRFQFGLLSLISLTAVAAVAMALLQAFNLPTWLYVIFAAYAILFAAYIVLRGIHMLRRSVALWRQSRANRKQLHDWLQEERERGATTNSDDPPL